MNAMGKVNKVRSNKGNKGMCVCYVNVSERGALDKFFILK